jgi:toxin ParE1/3/4
VTRSVQLTDDALRDLDDLHAYIAAADGSPRADQVVDGIAAVLAKLATFAERGEVPKELATLGMRHFRQVHHKPYRMIYQIEPKTVTVLLVADGRRDMQALLQRRLLGA